VLAIAAVARRRTLLVVLSIRTSVSKVDTMLVSTLMRVCFPAVRTQRAHGSVRIAPARQNGVGGPCGQDHSAKVGIQPAETNGFRSTRNGRGRGPLKRFIEFVTDQ
jgi:hypothetical protein